MPLVIRTACSRCHGDRLWVDFLGELQCVDCDPPHVIVKEKFQKALQNKIEQRQQVHVFEDEERADVGRILYQAEKAGQISRSEGKTLWAKARETDAMPGEREDEDFIKDLKKDV